MLYKNVILLWSKHFFYLLSSLNETSISFIPNTYTVGVLVPVCGSAFQLTLK